MFLFAFFNCRSFSPLTFLTATIEFSSFSSNKLRFLRFIISRSSANRAKVQVRFCSYFHVPVSPFPISRNLQNNFDYELK